MIHDETNGWDGQGREDAPDDSEWSEAYAETKKDLDRMVRRLDVLEWVVLFAAVGLALGGGALVAWMLTTGTNLSFRPTWIVASILLLVIPGAIFLLKERGGRDM